jgi:hypothetical protein
VFANWYKRSKRNDELHPFGYGREKGVFWFWLAMLFQLLFFQYLKVCIKLMEPIAVKILVGVLLFDCFNDCEGKTFMIALKQLETSKNSIIKALKDSVDTNLIVIILEDSAALLGLLIAFICTLLSLYNPM